MLGTVKEERKILHKIQRNKAEWIGRILRRSCLLKYVIEGKIEGAGRRGTSLKQLLDDLEEKK